MSAELQVALANETLELSQMFRQNAALLHGLPDVQPAERISKLTDPPARSTSTSSSEKTETTTVATAAGNSPSPGEGAAQQPGSRSLLSRAAPFLVTGALAAGVPFGALALLHKDAQPTVTQPAPSKDGDLLQYLQSQGRHLPEGWK